MSKNRQLSTTQIWGAPILLGVLSAIGLTTALISDDWGDTVAWLALAVPVLVVCRYWLKKPRKTSKAAASQQA